MRATSCAAILLTAVCVLAGCSRESERASSPAATQDAPPQAAGLLMVKGKLTYRARTALPEASSAVIELRNTSVPEGVIVAEHRFDLRGRQVPIPFELAAQRADLDPAGRYAIRGAVYVEGVPAWMTDPVEIDPKVQTVDVGELEMAPYKALAFATAYQCGDARITVGMADDAFQLTVATESFMLREIRAGSGAKYEALNDPTTTFWSKGERAWLEVRGKPFDECVKADSEGSAFRAAGNEPGWSLQILGDKMTLVTNYGERTVKATAAAPELTAEFRRYVGATSSGDLIATVYDKVCADVMSGMPFPHTVEVMFAGSTLKGCGGQPAALLHGPAWLVEDINGAGVVDNSRATLTFGSDGRVAGRATCNTYSADYRLAGEGLSVTQPVSTMMACAPALMRQEELFLDVLKGVQRFELTPDGLLTLHDSGGRTITARRPPELRR